jgi:hypothetical protein
LKINLFTPIRQLAESKLIFFAPRQQASRGKRRKSIIPYVYFQKIIEIY